MHFAPPRAFDASSAAAIASTAAVAGNAAAHVSSPVLLVQPLHNSLEVVVIVVPDALCRLLKGNPNITGYLKQLRQLLPGERFEAARVHYVVRRL